MRQAGLICRQAEPPNWEMPFRTLAGLITPAELFYIRTHFPIPNLSAEAFSLAIEGAVARPQRLSLADLQAMAAETWTVTLECAGNGRRLVGVELPGVPWETGAVGTATWTGARLDRILAGAGLSPAAVEIILAGADRGVVGEAKGAAAEPAEIPFARSVPTAKLPQVLLAWAMNGAPLTAAHGFPLRAIVAGDYAMSSVKWLTRIIATDRPFTGHFQAADYIAWRRLQGLWTRAPIGALQLKSQIARPEPGERILAGEPYRVHGAAWGGVNEIARVEVSDDGGRSWRPATWNEASPSPSKPGSAPARAAWRLWHFNWLAPAQPGFHRLSVRAVDIEGNSQPHSHDFTKGSYQIHHVHAVDVSVVSRG